MNCETNTLAKPQAIFGSRESTKTSIILVCPAARIRTLFAAAVSSRSRPSLDVGFNTPNASRQEGAGATGAAAQVGDEAFSLNTVRSARDSLWRILICV